MYADRIERELRERAERVRASFEIYGRDGLKGFTMNDIGLLGISMTHDLRQLRERIEQNPGNEADVLREEQLKAHLTDVTDEMKERSKTLER